MAKKVKFKMKKVHKGEKREKSVLDLRDKLWFILTIFCTLIYLTWRFLRTIPLEYGLVSLIAGIALFVVEFFGMIEAMIHYINMFTYQKFDVPVVPPQKYPHVDVFIATYNEPLDLVYKTINGCKYMDYPDKKKVHIYVCDDGHRPEMKEMAEKAGVNYITRPDNAHAKAGNLNNALSVTQSPYILTLDADMIPKHDLLMRTIPYFVDQEMKNEGLEEKEQIHIGFVQSPQAFHNPDLFQFNLYSEGRIPNEQDYFYRDIQVSRNRSNSVIYGGSNTVLSRMALEAAGGFFDKTITEDYGTGIAIQKQGFRCIATNEVLASGLSPTDLKSLITQRIRWARGVISTNRKQHIFLTTKLSIAQKANYWASEFYWLSPVKRLIYFLSPILFATFNFMVVKCTLLEVLLFWLPMYITSNISLRMLSRNIRTAKWTSVYETVLFPYMLLPILMEKLGITLKTFKVTKKGDVENEAGKNVVYMITFLLLIVLSIIGIIRCILMMMQSNGAGPIVVLFWLVFNLYTLVMACFFVMGRNYLRKSERVQAQEDCTVVASGTTYPCKTLDVSENGVAVRMDQPVFLKDDETVEIGITTDRYAAKLKAKIVHVDDRKDYWKYAFVIEDYCGTYDEYLQILYDRIPTLPQNLSKSGSVFGDLSINTGRRMEKPFYQNRKMPRVTMSASLPGEDGKTYTVTDFNYQFCTIKAEEEPEKVIRLTANTVPLHCLFSRSLSEGRALYLVENAHEIYADAEKRRMLEEWVAEKMGGEAEEEVSAQEEKQEEKEQAPQFDEMKTL